MSFEVQFNRIYIIESLLEDERKTGKELYDDLLRWKGDIIDSVYLEVKTKAEFFYALQLIEQTLINYRLIPFLHLEIHGNKKGLVLKNGEGILWHELVSVLRRINYLARNNVLLSLATCFGANIFREVDPAGRAFAWGFIGPWIEVFPEDISISFQGFFETLLATSDLNASVESLNKSNHLLLGSKRYHFYNCEEIFELAFNVYEKENYTPQKMEERISKLTWDAMHEKNSNDPFIFEVVSSQLRGLLANRGQIKQKFKKRFLIEDLAITDGVNKHQ